MATTLEAELRFELVARPAAWRPLTAVIPGAAERAAARLHALLGEVSSWEPAAYNEGDELGRALALAVQARRCLVPPAAPNAARRPHAARHQPRRPASPRLASRPAAAPGPPRRFRRARAG